MDAWQVLSKQDFNRKAKACRAVDGDKDHIRELEVGKDNGVILKQRWATSDGRIPEGGVLPIPFAFFDLAPRLGLNFTDVVTVLSFMRFKMNGDMPYPSLKRIADLMGTTRRTIRRSVEKMENMGYLKRIREPGAPCKYDFSTLLELVVLSSQSEKEG